MESAVTSPLAISKPMYFTAKKILLSLSINNVRRAFVEFGPFSSRSAFSIRVYSGNAFYPCLFRDDLPVIRRSARSSANPGIRLTS